MPLEDHVQDTHSVHIYIHQSEKGLLPLDACGTHRGMTLHKDSEELPWIEEQT